MSYKPRVIVVRAEEGKLVEREEHSTVDIASIAKTVAQKALEMWNPRESDFTVIRSSLELRFKLPIKPELYDILEELNLPKSVEQASKELYVQVPVYTISFDNTWEGDKYFDRKMYVVALVLDDNSAKQVEEYAIEATKAPKQLGSELQLDTEALRRLEEGLEEAEEKPRTTRRRRKKSSM